MSFTKLNGQVVTISGSLPPIGGRAPNATLVNDALESIQLNSFQGTSLILNVFPSIDTSVCAASVRRFHEEAGRRPELKVLCISRDLPFAQKRFCAAEGLDHVLCLSDFRTGEFGSAFGLTIQDGPLTRLLARAVLAIDKNGVILQSQLVPEITEEPDYQKVLDCFPS